MRNIVMAGVLVVALLLPQVALARSAFSPRHTGMEPPGEPKVLQNMPGRPMGRTPDGGRGYIDAYGNALRDNSQQARASRPQERPSRAPKASLPDPDKFSGNPLWKFD